MGCAGFDEVAERAVDTGAGSGENIQACNSTLVKVLVRSVQKNIARVEVVVRVAGATARVRPDQASRDYGSKPGDNETPKRWRSGPDRGIVLWTTRVVWG